MPQYSDTGYRKWKHFRALLMVEFGVLPATQKIADWSGRI
jgi:hypothetical protein